jgi:MFS family permease
MRLLPDALREREFRLLFFGQLISSFGDRMTPIAYTFAILDLTGNVSDVGFVLAAESVPMVVFFLVGGVWADRISRVKVMLASDIVRFACQTTIAILLITGQARIGHLIALSAIYGSALAFFFPAFSGMPPLIVKSDRFQEANALLGLSRNITAIFGPIAAGVAIALIGAGWAILVDAGTFLISAAFLVRMRVPALAREAQVRDFLSDLRQGWTEFKAHTWLWTIVLHASFFIMIALSAVFVLGPFLSDEHYGGAPAWAAISTAFGLGSVLGGVLAIYYKPKRLLLVGELLMFLEVPRLILMAMIAPLWTIVASSVLTGITMSLFGALWMTAIHENIPEESMSRVSAYDWMGSFAFQPIGMALVGPIAVAVGTSAVLWFAAIFVVISTLVVLCIPDVRNLHRKSAQRSTAPEMDSGAVTKASL